MSTIELIACVQVFDENGDFVDQWSPGPESQVLFLYVSADRHLWIPDGATSRILEYDFYSWGSFGDWPGALWSVHQVSVDPEGNLYVAEVSNGRVQKFRPSKGVNPGFLVGQPVRAAWR